MRREEVPQQYARAYHGQGKALYAVDAEGRYALVKSSGWEAEEIVLDQAIGECERLAAAAHARAVRGETSPLEYHMYRLRMDIVVLAQSVGMFAWRVRRHLRPGAFARLPERLRARYAEAFGMSADALDALPEGP